MESSAEKKEVEIFWGLKCVLSDMLAFSVNDISDLFELIISDIEIAKDFQMRRTKITHLISLTIAPYFVEILMCELKSCDYYSILLHVCYWSRSENQICIHYSLFRFQSSSYDLLTNFIDVINHVNGGNHMTEVSMDRHQLTGSSSRCHKK